MGALDAPVFLRGIPLQSGDVGRFVPRGLRRWIRRAFFAIVDVRDTSIPYVVLRRGRRVWKVPLQGAPFAGAGWDVVVLRHPDVDRARGGVIAARAAERPGEGVHHPGYDCGRDIGSDAALVADAYAAAGVDVAFDRGGPGAPFAAVPRAGPDVGDGGRGASGPREDTGAGASFLRRGIEKTLPWQKRGRR